MFQQHMYNDQVKFKNYLKNFLRNKKDCPLDCLALYMQGHQDLCIQSIELNGMNTDFKTDQDLYTFLVEFMYSKEAIEAAEHFLKFIKTKIDFLNANLCDEDIASNSIKFRQFQKEIDIFHNEL